MNEERFSYILGVAPALQSCDAEFTQRGCLPPHLKFKRSWPDEYIHVCTESNIMERLETKLGRIAYSAGCAATHIGLVAFVLCGVAAAQIQSPGLTSLPSAEQVIQRSQDPYSGSI